MKQVIYDTNSGIVIGWAAAGSHLSVIPDGCSATDLPDTADVIPAVHKITNGDLVAIPGIDTLTEPRLAKLHALSAKRYEVETAGITVGGVKIKTDRESQAQINGAYAALSAGFLTSTKWKGVSGWTTVTLTEMAPIAKAVSNHVATCFARECELSDSINSAADTDALKAIDITSGWPDGSSQ